MQNENPFDRYTQEEITEDFSKFVKEDHEFMIDFYRYFVGRVNKFNSNISLSICERVVRVPIPFDIFSRVVDGYLYQDNVKPSLWSESK